MLAARPARNPLRSRTITCALSGRPPTTFVSSVKQAVAECHVVPLDTTILDCPDGSAIFAKPGDGRFRHQNGLRQMHGRDVDLGLLADVESIRYPVVGNRYPALLVDAITFRLDTGDFPPDALTGTRAQDDLCRLADLDLAALLSSI